MTVADNDDDDAEPPTPIRTYTNERAHGHGVVAQHTAHARRRRRRLARHRGADVRAVLPVARLEDERHRVRATTAKNDGVNRHALRVLPVLVDDRTLTSGRRETRVRVSGWEEVE